MQLNLLNAYFEAYQKQLTQNQKFYIEVLWDIQRNFSTHWDIEAPDFTEMYKRALDSQVSRRLWKLKNGDAKSRMIELLQIDEEFGRRLFRGLMDPEKELSYRISHFQFGCEVLMEEFRKKHPNSIETDHLHLNNHMTTLYLSLSAPKQYAILYSDIFIAFMQNIGATELPVPNDFDRFQKVMKTVYGFIEKDETLKATCLEILPEQYHDLGLCHFVTTDFYRWAGKRKL